MKTIHITAIPNQEFSFVLNNQRYDVTLNSRNGKTYLSYRTDKASVLVNRICLDRVSIDDLFMFEDMQGKEDPYYDGFNHRFKLRLLID